jgi:hypothetical protein
MSRIHSDRLNTKRLHKGFAAGAKKALEQLGQVPQTPTRVSPEMFDVEPLAFPVPPTLDRALGYGGNLRFVHFGYSANNGQFEYCDGGDDMLSTGKSVWRWFLGHPVISPHVPKSKYPTLYGIFPPAQSRPTLEQIKTTNRISFPAHDLAVHHYLLLDRQELKAYVARRDQTLIFFALAHPDDEDPHTVFVDDLLMSPGTEDYKAAPSKDWVEQVQRFLDAQSATSRVV